MTAGRIGASGLEVPRRGVRLPRRAVLGSVVVIVGLALTLAILTVVAYGGPRDAMVPGAGPAVAPAAAPVVTPAPAAGPTTVAPVPTLELPSVFGPGSPGRAPSDLIPSRPLPGRSWGLYVD